MSRTKLPLILCAGVLASFVLGACQTPSQQSSAVSTTPTTSASSSIPAASSSTSIPTVSWDASKDKIVDGFSAGGIFTDINVGTPLVSGETYTFPISFSDGSLSATEGTIQSSNESVLSFVKNPSNAASYIGTAHQAGDVVVTVKDGTGYRRYRNLVNIRDGVSVDKMDNYLSYSISYFESDKALSIDSTTDLKISFMGDGTGLMSGTFEGSKLDSGATFTYAKDDSIDMEDYLGYAISDFAVKNVSFNPKYFRIHKTGYMLHLLDNNGILNILMPVK